MPLDHFCVIVPEGKLEEMVSWLVASNSVFGFREIMRPVSHVVGLGEERPYFWVWSDPTTEATDAQVREWEKQHIAFTAESEHHRPLRSINAETYLGFKDVQTWHEAAIKAGGEDNGKPGPRPEYHPGYHAAFVRDPVLGINFEVVYREPNGKNILVDDSFSA